MSQHKLTVGFVPLTDSAPLIVAQNQGFFDAFGLQVELQPQNSWATLRDKLHAGLLDAAQMLAPLPFASTLGLSGSQCDVIAPMIMSLNGNAITLSHALVSELLAANELEELSPPLSGAMLAAVVEKRKQANAPRLKFATVFPFSCHHYQLLDWFEAGGVDASDIDLLVVPPVNMANSLTEGDIDGYCVGGPWNAKAVRDGIGVTVITSRDIWQDFPEKVLGIRAERYEQDPVTMQNFCRALLSACKWLGSVPNRFEAANQLAHPDYLNADLNVIAPSLIGSCLVSATKSPRHIPAYNQFSAQAGWDMNAPRISVGFSLVNKMISAGQLDNFADINALVRKVFRKDIFAEVVSGLNR